jgi:hypothetical protein
MGVKRDLESVIYYYTGFYHWINIPDRSHCANLCNSLETLSVGEVTGDLYGTGNPCGAVLLSHTSGNDHPGPIISPGSFIQTGPAAIPGDDKSH